MYKENTARIIMIPIEIEKKFELYWEIEWINKLFFLKNEKNYW